MANSYLYDPDSSPATDEYEAVACEVMERVENRIDADRSEIRSLRTVISRRSAHRLLNHFADASDPNSDDFLDSLEEALDTTQAKHPRYVAVELARTGWRFLTDNEEEAVGVCRDDRSRNSIRAVVARG